MPVMNGEFNDLSTRNNEPTFSLSTNNVATSDELNVDPVYTEKVVNSYAAGKKAKKITKIVAITFAVASAALLGGNFLTNAFITNPPSVSKSEFIILEGTDTFSYKFTLTNKENRYSVTFLVKSDTEKYLTLDVSKTNTYEGKIENLGYGKTITYTISFTNKLDYKKNLLQGSLVIPGE